MAALWKWNETIMPTNPDRKNTERCILKSKRVNRWQNKVQETECACFHGNNDILTMFAVCKQVFAGFNFFFVELPINQEKLHQHFLFLNGPSFNSFLSYFFNNAQLYSTSDLHKTSVPILGKCLDLFQRIPRRTAK